jgi:RNA polymerase sigma factor (sigma-70 family)
MRTERLVADLDVLSEERLLWSSTHAGCDDEQRELAVRNAVRDALSDKQREVVEAFFFEGLSQHEIARRLGIRQQVVHKRLYGVTRAGKPIGGALLRLKQALLPLAP